MTTEKKSAESFDFFGLGIAPKLLKILEELKFSVPTPIQLKSIPITIEGKDIVGIAQTGTGKTLAYGIPMIQRLAQFKGRGLVVLPTRELAAQVDESIRQVGQKLGLRTALLIGGEPKGRQLYAMRGNPHIIIATPGRLIDFLDNKIINLRDIKILVLDEADMMFDMGFMPQVNKILEMVPRERQTMLFSATMPPAIMKIVTKYMSLPIRIEVAPAGTPAESVIQEMIIVKNEDKFNLLEEMLDEYTGSILIFARTKYGVRNLTMKLKRAHHSADEIHSNRSPIQRREALAGFKNGRYRILVATDIAARGIDVKGIELVMNYDLPDNSEDYVHRIGRTGRAGKTGRAISFVLPAQIKEIGHIERLIRKNIPVKNRSGAALPARNISKQKTDKPFQKQFSPRPEKRNFNQPDKATVKKPFAKRFPAKPETRRFNQTARPDSEKKFTKKFSSSSRPNITTYKKPLTDKQRFSQSMRRSKKF